jgi:hypothetical protein
MRLSSSIQANSRSNSGSVFSPKFSGRGWDYAKLPVVALGSTLAAGVVAGVVNVTGAIVFDTPLSGKAFAGLTLVPATTATLLSGKRIYSKQERELQSAAQRLRDAELGVQVAQNLQNQPFSVPVPAPKVERKSIALLDSQGNKISIVKSSPHSPHGQFIGNRFMANVNPEKPVLQIPVRETSIVDTAGQPILLHESRGVTNIREIDLKAAEEKEAQAREDFDRARRWF